MNTFRYGTEETKKDYLTLSLMYIKDDFPLQISLANRIKEFFKYYANKIA